MAKKTKIKEERKFVCEGCHHVVPISHLLNLSTSYKKGIGATCPHCKDFTFVTITGHGVPVSDAFLGKPEKKRSKKK